MANVDAGPPPLRAGGKGALYGMLMRGLSRHAGLRLFRFFVRDVEPGRPGAPPAGLELRLLGERDVLALCQDAQLDLREAAVRAAYARGDMCVAVFARGGLAGYCWLAFAPLPHLDGAWVEFHRNVAWTYKSYVRPMHRGRGLAALLYRLADQACFERGRTRSVICVESHNAPSVSAALRAGYRPAGLGAYLKRGSRLFSWSSAAAKRQGAVRFYLP